MDSSEKVKKQVPKEHFKLWESFSQDIKSALDEVIVSFKQNLRVINKLVNHHQKFGEKGKKQQVKQTKGDAWAIRKPMHKDTVFGEVNLQKIKEISWKIAFESPKSIVEKEFKEKIIELKIKGLDTKQTKERFFATRKPLDTNFNQKQITSIADTGIQKILLKHLEQKENNPELAFSPEDIEEMNRKTLKC
ncbi:MAG: hypothetical protein ACRC0A_03695 [Chitinophagaceae bacterium]